MNTQDIVKNGQGITLEKTGSVQAEFCSLWPKVEQGLQMLQEIIKNPFVKVSIGAVIAAGQVVSTRLCGENK